MDRESVVMIGDRLQKIMKSYFYLIDMLPKDGKYHERFDNTLSDIRYCLDVIGEFNELKDVRKIDTERYDKTMRSLELEEDRLDCCSGLPESVDPSSHKWDLYEVLPLENFPDPEEHPLVTL
jgi:hypothetical protein